MWSQALGQAKGLVYRASKTNMKIIVTQADIDNGIRNQGDKCAIALALKRDGHNSVNVSGYGGISADGIDYKSNKTMEEWIKAFDRSDKVKPHTFVVSPIQHKHLRQLVPTY